MFFVVLIEGHEDDIDDNAEGDEEFGERVEDDEGETFADLDPNGTTVPNAHDVDGLGQPLAEDVLEFRAFIVIVVVYEPAQVSGFAQWAFRHLVDYVAQDPDVLERQTVHSRTDD